jgi:hypothetical protein
MNAIIIYRNKARKRIDQLSVRIQLIEGLCETCCWMQSVGLTFVRQNSGMPKRKKIYKQDSTNCKQLKTTETVFVC